MLVLKVLPWTAAQQQKATTPGTTEGKTLIPKKGTQAVTDAAASAVNAVLPTEEQQAAAAAELATGEVSSPIIYTETGATGTITTTTTTTTTIPGRSGLRMGRFAPPEEAASAASNEDVTPNAAELRGLRSPKLPQQLPLNIDGQTKPADQ